MELLKRIDQALQASGKTRADLARELGISTQAITSLGRRPNATMKHENLVKAAMVLNCEVDWLASGRGRYRTKMHAPPAPAAAHGVFVQGSYTNTQMSEAALEMRASMVAMMFRELPTDEDRKDVVAFMAQRMAQAAKAKA